MDLSWLKTLVPAERHREVEDLYAAYLRHSGGRPALSAFVLELAALGVLPSTHLAEALALSEVSVTPPSRGAEEFRERQAEAPRHRRLALLGRGAMGEVHIALDRDLNRAVAVKRIDPAHGDRSAFARRFFVEAQITGQLDHPSIVPIHTIESDDEGVFSYAMKLVRGQTLSDYIADARAAYADEGSDRTGYSLLERLALFLPICDAIAYAHSRGVIHRDIKPDNVMVGAYSEVMVMDWGLARVLGEGSTIALDGDEQSDVTLDHRATMTQAGRIFGTVNYMAPEQARGDNDVVDAKSDQVGLGLLLYELVSLRQAIVGDTNEEIVRRAALAWRRRLVFFNRRERIPRALAAIIGKATAHDRQARYPDVASLAADVRRFIQNEEVEARPDSPVEKLTRWISRHRATALGIGLGLVVLSLVVAGVMYLSGQAALQDQREAAQRREAAVAQLMSTINAHIQEVDGEFARLQSLLVGMAYAAQVALSEPPLATRDYYLCRDFDEPGRAPPDLAPSRIQRKPISVAHLCQEVAPGTPASDELVARHRQLARLSRPFFRTYLQSHAPDALDLSVAQQHSLIRDEGVPLITVYLGTAEGIMATYPGRDTQRDDYDPRKRPWYEPATRVRGPVWMAVDSASALKGLLMTCSMAVRDAADEVLGVAAIDLMFSWVIERFLDPPRLPAPVEAYFLAADGKVIVQSSMRSVADKVNMLDAEPFPYPGLLARFKDQASGHDTLGQGVDATLVAWTHLPSTGWTYVLVGRDAALLPPAAPTAEAAD